MNISLLSWLVIGLALAFASLPFLSERFLAVFALKSFPQKPIWLRLFELITYYCLVGLLGFALEANTGNPFPQSKEFYVVTFCMFIVFAFPAFTYRYLKK